MIFTLREGEHVVKGSRFIEEQIAFALKQAELGTEVDEICRKVGHQRCHVLQVAPEVRWPGDLPPASRSAYATCPSLNLDLFIASPYTFSGLPESNRTSSFEIAGTRGRRQRLLLHDRHAHEKPPRAV